MNKRINAILKNKIDKRLETTLDWSCHPQPTAWPKFLKIKVKDKSASILSSTPKPKTKPWRHAFFSEDSFTKDITFRAMTGKTQGIIFKIIPPKKAKIIATQKDKFDIFGKGGGDALADQFAIPLLGKIPISEGTNDIADDGTPLISQDNETPTKSAIEKLITVIAKKLPPIVDETCTGRLAKVFEELSK